MADKAGFITRYRQEIGRILDAIDGELQLLDAQYDALGYATDLVDEDFTGVNADLTAQQFKDGVAALRTVRASVQGNSTNIFRLRRENW